MRIAIVALGGAGNNVLRNFCLHSAFADDVVTIACNTDTQALDLSKSLVNYTLVIGPTICDGLGAGNKPKVGFDAMTESYDDLMKILKKENIECVVLLAGLGGGTGTGAIQYLLQKGLGSIMSIPFVTTPFSFEGRKRVQSGINTMDMLMSNRCLFTSSCILQSDSIRGKKDENGKSLTMSQSFLLLDNLIKETVESFLYITSSTGLMNIDVEDIKELLTNSKKLYPAYYSIDLQEGTELTVRDIIQTISNIDMFDKTTYKKPEAFLIAFSSYAKDSESIFTMDFVENVTSGIKMSNKTADVLLGIYTHNTAGSALEIRVISVH